MVFKQSKRTEGLIAVCLMPGCCCCQLPCRRTSAAGSQDPTHAWHHAPCISYPPPPPTTHAHLTSILPSHYHRAPIKCTPRPPTPTPPTPRCAPPDPLAARHRARLRRPPCEAARQAPCTHGGMTPRGVGEGGGGGGTSIRASRQARRSCWARKQSATQAFTCIPPTSNATTFSPRHAVSCVGSAQNSNLRTLHVVFMKPAKEGRRRHDK